MFRAAQPSKFIRFSQTEMPCSVWNEVTTSAGSLFSASQFANGSSEIRSGWTEWRSWITWPNRTIAMQVVSSGSLSPLLGSFVAGLQVDDTGSTFSAWYASVGPIRGRPVTFFRGPLPDFGPPRAIGLAAAGRSLIVAGNKQVFAIDVVSGALSVVQLLDYETGNSLFTDVKQTSSGLTLADAGVGTLLALTVHSDNSSASVHVIRKPSSRGSVAGLAPIFGTRLAWVTGWLPGKCLVQAVNLTSGELLPGVGRACIEPYPWAQIPNAPTILSV